MSELLRITMDAKLIRTACTAFAFRNTTFQVADTSVEAIGVPDDLTVSIVFTKKRIRKAKGAPNAG